jgi:hypothetical protein
MITRKTYRELAHDIGVTIKGHDNTETWELIDVFCGVLKRDNERFNKDLFIEAIQKEIQK